MEATRSLFAIALRAEISRTGDLRYKVRYNSLRFRLRHVSCTKRLGDERNILDYNEMWTASSALTWITLINFLIVAVTARGARFSHSPFRGRHSFRPSRTRPYDIAPRDITLPVSKKQPPPPQLDFTDLHPLVDRPKIGTSAVLPPPI
jgi:hypothetical protein